MSKKVKKSNRKVIHKAKHKIEVHSKLHVKPAKHVKKHLIKHKSKHKQAHQKHSTAHKNIKKVIVHKQYAKKFCPNCGGTIIDGGTLCKNCRVVDFDFKEIKLFTCNNCKSYNYKNKWKKFYNLNSILKEIVQSSVKQAVHYQNLPEEKIEELLSYKAGVHKDFTVTVSTGKENFDLPGIIDVTLCPKCSKQGTKYFEGVLQIRNATPEINDFIKNDLHKNKSRGVHVNKEVDIDGTGANVDYYYTDKKYLKVISEKLRKNFGARIKHNAQLFSIDWETSKNLYRLNVLVELPKYRKNDVIKMDEQLYKIISMDEKIHVINMKNNTKTLIPHKDSYDVLKPLEVMLIKKYPEFEILDPTTYYQARLMNPSENLEINQKIQVIIDGGEAWIVRE